MAAWTGSRIFLEIRDVQSSQQTYDSLVIPEMKRYQPFAKWLYSDKNIYSFYSGIPIPPPLAVVMLKRLWSGDMTNERIAMEMEHYEPELILLSNDNRIMPFQRQINTEYQLVYEDSDFRLYALKTIIKKVQM